jgi:hypothetical protein
MKNVQRKLQVKLLFSDAFFKFSFTLIKLKDIYLWPKYLKGLLPSPENKTIKPI